MHTVTNFIHHVYTHAHPGSKHSWRKLNHSLRKALELAITSEMRFTKRDISRIYEQCKGEYWFASREWILSLACQVGNATAAASYLHFVGRPRFVVPRHAQVIPPKSRLELMFVGRQLLWEDEEVKVTSFNDDRGTVTMCTFDGALYSPKVKRRFTCTPGELREGFDRMEGAK